ncbi:MAG: hypothetical protein U0R51_12230 [Solirubrobacterales bacterium]
MKSRRTTFTALIAAVAVASLAIGPAAGAHTATDRLVAFGISFDTVYKQGKPAKVKNLVYSNLKMDCDGGGTFYSPSAKFGKLTVEKRAFKGTLKVDGVTSKVTGKYKRDLTKVSGTLTAKGNPPGHTNCQQSTTWQESLAQR